MDRINDQISLLHCVKDVYVLLGDISKVEEVQMNIEYLEHKKNIIIKQNKRIKFKFK